MGNSFTVELFDILVYLLPGSILVAAAMLFSDRLASFLLAMDSALRIVVLILVSFYLGVLAHVLAAGLDSLSTRVSGHSVVGRNIERFPDFPLVQETVRSLIPGSRDDKVVTFRYAESYVKEQTQRQSASVSRLVALSMFCRNSMIPLFLFAFVLFRRAKINKKLQAALFWGTVVGAELLLVRAYVSYWSAAIHKILRTFLVETSLL